MKIIAINGSPRNNHNTGTLLKEAINGAVSKGAEVEIINLYKLNYKGCIACMSCKRRNNKHVCVAKDDLTEVFEKIKNSDAVIFSSPIYFSDITGEMRSFLERLLYPSYHMNKKNWITIILDDTLSDEEIMEYVSISHRYTEKKL